MAILRKSKEQMSPADEIENLFREKVALENVRRGEAEGSSKIQIIPVDNIAPFPNNPYKVIDDEEMESLTESIKENGILTPLMVRRASEKDSNIFELISGHRRLYAAKKAGLEKVPAFVYCVSRDEAAIMVVDSNLYREHILPSEKAKAYKLKYDAMKHQGKRSDLTSEQIAPKLTAEAIAEQDGISKDTVKRYIRLNKLIPEFLDRMDNGEIAFSVGVELSYLDEDTQYSLSDMIDELDHTPSYAQANRMHKDFVAGTLTVESMESMLGSDKPNQRPVYKVSAEKFSKYLNPGSTQKEAEEYLLKACEHYSKFLLRKQSKEAR